MAITRTNIGRIPVLKGAYSATTTYKKTNQVTAYGSTYQSLIDSNTGNAPYSINATTGKVSHANTDKWRVIADGSTAYNEAIDAAASVEESIAVIHKNVVGIEYNATTGKIDALIGSFNMTTSVETSENGDVILCEEITA